MKILRPAIASLALVLLLSGCCYFSPCHFGTYIAGAVTDAVTGQPIADADVRLYHYETRSAAFGCFKLGGPDALPFEFAVSAPGYKSAVVKAVPGSYEATVKLAPAGSPGTSTATTRKIPQDRYAALSRSCP